MLQTSPFTEATLSWKVWCLVALPMTQCCEHHVIFGRPRPPRPTYIGRLGSQCHLPLSVRWQYELLPSTSPKHLSKSITYISQSVNRLTPQRHIAPQHRLSPQHHLSPQWPPRQLSEWHWTGHQTRFTPAYSWRKREDYTPEQTWTSSFCRRMKTTPSPQPSVWKTAK